MTTKELKQQIESILDEHHFKECRSEVLFQFNELFNRIEALTREQTAREIITHVTNVVLDKATYYKSSMEMSGEICRSINELKKKYE